MTKPRASVFLVLAFLSACTGNPPTAGGTPQAHHSDDPYEEGFADGYLAVPLLTSLPADTAEARDRYYQGYEAGRQAVQSDLGRTTALDFVVSENDCADPTTDALIQGDASGRRFGISNNRAFLAGAIGRLRQLDSSPTNPPSASPSPYNDAIWDALYRTGIAVAEAAVDANHGESDARLSQDGAAMFNEQAYAWGQRLAASGLYCPAPLFTL